MGHDDNKSGAQSPPPKADDTAKPQRAREPHEVPPASTDESMTGEEDPGASLDSVVNPLPPANRPA